MQQNTAPLNVIKLTIKTNNKFNHWLIVIDEIERILSFD